LEETWKKAFKSFELCFTMGAQALEKKMHLILCVKQRAAESGECSMFPLTSSRYTSLTDAINLLLSVAHFSHSEWQSAFTHLQLVQSPDFDSFCLYLKGTLQ